MYNNKILKNNFLSIIMFMNSGNTSVNTCALICSSKLYQAARELNENLTQQQFIDGQPEKIRAKLSSWSLQKVNSLDLYDFLCTDFPRYEDLGEFKITYSFIYGNKYEHNLAVLTYLLRYVRLCNRNNNKAEDEKILIAIINELLSGFY